MSPGSTRDVVTRAWAKYDIVNHLAAVHGYRRYLELCTAERLPELERSATRQST